MPEERHPLIFAMQHLHVSSPGASDSATEISAQVRLMQGDREVPSAGDSDVERFLAENHAAPAPPDIMLEILRMEFAHWPDAVVQAMQGITEFGAGAIGPAEASAHRSLQSDSRCKLGRQLVRMLAAKQELRLKSGTPVSNAPDVPAILSQ